ncbi:MAG: YqaJ viral recombinase family protein, partial [Bauldia litoralis]
MDGDWLALWEEKTGRRTPEDLSGVLPVQIGIVTEDLNRRWFEQQTGQQVYRDKCDDLVHPEHGFMRGNLDGRVGAGVIECKHVSAFTKDEAVVSRYYPQVQHYLALTGGDIAFLSVIWGNHRWDFFEVDPDPGYQEQLIDREAAFWHHVEHDIPPEDTGAAEVEVAFDAMRSVDMTGHNRWAALAGDWLETRRAATVFTD